jgi:serine/threonine protein kinase
VTLDGDTGDGDGDSDRDIDRGIEGSPSGGPETLLADATESVGPGSSHDERDDDPTSIGRFVVLRRLGEGGMGVVYAAYDNELDRRLAIKVVHRARARGAHQGRGRRGAHALARRSHPHLVQV